MTRGAHLFRQIPLALCWGALAAPALLFTRFDGGLAFLWGASAVLIVALIRTSRRHWWAPLTACGLVSIPVSGLWGIGWTWTVPMACANLLEPAIAAWLMKRREGSGELMASLTWFRRFLIAMTIAPLIVSPLPVGLAMLAGMGSDPFTSFSHFFAGHSLGNLAVAPIAFLLTGKAARRETLHILHQRRHDAAWVLPLVIAVTLLVFAQSSWPILFLPVMIVVFATFRLGRLGAATSLTLLIIIGGILTAQGSGPIKLSGAPLGERLQFFQFYIAATVLTVLPIAADLHARRKLLRQLRRSEAEFRMLAEHCTDVIMRLRSDGRIAYVSPSIETLAGYRPEQLLGRRIRLLVDPRDLDRVVAEHRNCMAEGGSAHSFAFRVRTSSGEVRWLQTHARAIVTGDGSATDILAILRDVTAFKDREAELSQAALTDRLTGLPNRRALEARLASLRPGDHCLALLDLDRFKQVNDTYGHDAGDEVLKGFADVARRLVRSHDTVARLGGEEFVILFEHTSVDQAYQVCDRMRRIVGQTLLATPAGPIRITISGGVATIGRGGLGASLKAADEALYRAKRGGRDRMLLAA